MSLCLIGLHRWIATGVLTTSTGEISTWKSCSRCGLDKQISEKEYDRITRKSFCREPSAEPSSSSELHQDV